ncbi:MarR family winged helix-turn-helix transcriptional regulator [Kribbella sp. NBC_00382]|uniref:MarR family winged helix-turn-helix transcriptional regulator n=1 Tax=Kribbella sp. NBC_00382 TaxID=2975967 RepID=UPI002E24ABF9
MTRYPGGPAESPGFLLWHVTHTWQRAITTALAPLDLTHVQFVLLACTWWLTNEGHTPNQQDLAHQAGTDIKMTSQVLKTLENKGLLTRQPSPTDARAKTLTPTKAGVNLAKKAITAVEAVDTKFFAPVSTEALLKTLTKLTAAQGS